MKTIPTTPERLREIERMAERATRRRTIKGTDNDYTQLKRSATSMLRAAEKCQIDIMIIQQIQMIRRSIDRGEVLYGIHLVTATR